MAGRIGSPAKRARTTARKAGVRKAFAAMKKRDPKSVVRGSEFAAARKKRRK